MKATEKIDYSKPIELCFSPALARACLIVYTLMAAFFGCIAAASFCGVLSPSSSPPLVWLIWLAIVATVGAPIAIYCGIRLYTHTPVLLLDSQGITFYKSKSNFVFTPYNTITDLIIHRTPYGEKNGRLKFVLDSEFGVSGNPKLLAKNKRKHQCSFQVWDQTIGIRVEALYRIAASCCILHSNPKQPFEAKDLQFISVSDLRYYFENRYDLSKLCEKRQTKKLYRIQSISKRNTGEQS